MLALRPQQMAAFQAESMKRFADEMVAHVAWFSPELFAAVGEPQIRLAVEQGLRDATRHGLSRRGSMRLYLELMVSLGSGFDRDPQYPWAADILGRPKPADELRRAELLYDQALRYRDAVVGEDDAMVDAALQRLAGWARQPSRPPEEDAAFKSWLMSEAAFVFPEKTAYIGEAALGAVIDGASAVAATHGMYSPRARLVMTVLKLGFGYNCEADLLYPWIARTLARAPALGPDRCCAQLESKALTWLDAVLADTDSRQTT